MIMRAFALGALWGTAVASMESFLINHTLHVGLQEPLALLELLVNYAIYVGVGSAILYLALALLLRRRSRASGGEPLGTSGTPLKRRDAASWTEAIIGSGLFVGALVTYVQKGPWGPIPTTWTVGLGIAVVGGGLIALLAWGLTRMSSAGIKTVRAALVACLVAGFVWTPLFGPYGGVLRRAEAKKAQAPARNVLLIIMDTLRADYLDCYGATWGASPVVDRLAAGGALFENNVGQSTWTLPSTASILTGLHPSTHGAVATGMSVSSTSPMIAEVLQRAGYRTGAFTENAYIRPQCGFGRGFDRFWTYWLPWVLDRTVLYRVLARLPSPKLPKIEFTNKKAYVTIPDIAGPEEVNWDARAATDAVLEWLREDPHGPFFAFVHYMGPHSPYGPREYMLEDPSPSRALTDYPRPMGGAFPIGEPGAPATEQEIEVMKTLYAADIRYVDYHIGRILEWLEENGKLSETLVVLTADHGEEFLDHGSWNHGSSAFSEVARVPFIVYDEGTVPAGIRIRDLTRQIDLMPTVLDLLGIACPREIQGRSVRPLLDGVPLNPEPAYVEVYPALPTGADINALVDDRHKIVRVELGGRSAVLLYDLQGDPEERVNLADANPALRDSLLVEMDKWDQVLRANSPIDPERLKHFRSLGYINN
jgi:arylsulfatase A-like enzyme